jgi:hypothetical protein
MYFQGESIDMTFGEILHITTMAGKICCVKLYMYDGILCYDIRGQTQSNHQKQICYENFF